MNKQTDVVYITTKLKETNMFTPDLKKEEQELNSLNHLHVYYIKKNSNGHKKGLLMSYVDENGDLKLGYSMCHRNDKFNAKIGKYIAYHRAICLEQRHTTIPQVIKRHLEKFVVRCKKYYKDKQLPRWVLSLEEVNEG